MPFYNYHLKFELYPNPDLEATLSHYDKDPANIWLPTDAAGIFGQLPSHPRIHSATAGGKSTWTTSAARSVTDTRDKTWAHDYIPAEDRRQIQQHHSQVIDCGPSRLVQRGLSTSTGETDAESNITHVSERQFRARSQSIPAPKFTAGLRPKTAAKDWRFGRINIESFDLDGDETDTTAGKGGLGMLGNNTGQKMVESNAEASGAASGSTSNTAGVMPAASLGPTLGGAAQATRARYVPLETKNTEIGWGIVHLYREGSDGSSSKATASSVDKGIEGVNDDDGTILCIPAVPGYLSPSDFLGFVGEKWRGDVSHYRMVMTSRMNRYMVLMKFRDAKRAKEWRKEFDGKVFNSLEAEICHVTYIKSITVETPTKPVPRFSEPSSSVSSSLKPFPPPTADLVELPTCPVCLERMDDTTGLMTILCQHVFHCTCLQTWKGSGCPVCRASTKPAHPPTSSPLDQPFGAGVSNLCTVCDEASDLWICLICGNVGCGRYKGGHAKDHWKETAHCFSLELETQHVWDYAGDMWVHRLIRDKGDGKVVELPQRPSREADDDNGIYDEDVVPRAKLDSIGLEYTHLLTSQLESQRVYFEELVSKAADKASRASASAESASLAAAEAIRQLNELRAEHATQKTETLPSLERDLARERKRADKAGDLARAMGKSLQEEKRVSEGLMARIEHVNRELEAVKIEMAKLKEENEELKDTNRDLTMFISGQEKLKEMENEGQIEAGELEEGTASVPEQKRKKGKGKAKK
ncbi:uncharacterized protein PgNI_04197 [Pyricularia grisea]|uniref:Uncharacterized protein n=1 Tax=Pyricularia grisea TaxID=148305 RepID=A0A6P8BF47_PYRGI|nr:uncharacterized protein PgNI_04197 [Pyricularia grisea]TLD14327.1 hypothetical protein PgNI_04197 [Pyricularia grisea]